MKKNKGIISETEYLLSSKTNAEWLNKSLEEYRQGKITQHELDEQEEGTQD